CLIPAYSRPEFFNDTYRLMPNRQPGLYWILTLQYVEIGPTYCRERHAHQSLVVSGLRHVFRSDGDAIHALEDVCFHFCHGSSSFHRALLVRAERSILQCSTHGLIRAVHNCTTVTSPLIARQMLSCPEI